MKTILNKVDPNYINCMNGVCEHAEHKVNSLWWVVPVCILSYIICKTYGRA